MSRGRFLRTAGLGAAGVGATMVGMGGVASAARKTPYTPPRLDGETLKAIKKRGYVRAAVHSSGIYGFFQEAKPSVSSVWPQEDIDNLVAPWGIEADFARALAAAVFNDPSKVEFVPSNPISRFQLLRDKDVDVIFRVCTMTLTRDTYISTLGADNVPIHSTFNFAPTYYYDGQDILVKPNEMPTKIGVVPGTTSETNILPWAEENGVQVVTVGSNGASYEENSEVEADYKSGFINAMTTDSSALIGYLLSDSNNTGYLYFNANDLPLLSKEPLAPATRGDDRQWDDIVRWTMFVLFEMEEKGPQEVTAKVDGLGPNMGLSTMWASNIYSGVGTYGDIYAHNLRESAWPMRGLNNQWNDTPKGLIFSPPGK